MIGTQSQSAGKGLTKTNYDEYSLFAEKTQTHTRTSPTGHTRKERVYYLRHQFGNPADVNIQINMATLEAS